MIDWFFEYVLPTFFTAILLLVLIGLPASCVNDAKQEQVIKECFMQDIKTKECEYILWKYENRTKSNSTVMPTPVVVRGN